MQTNPFKLWLSKKINHLWYQEHTKTSPLLNILSALYISIQRKDRQRKLNKAWRAPVPVIVVGNITTGGTGKTPMVIALAQLLIANNFKPGVISRGYQSNATSYPLYVTGNSDPKIAGDEPVIIADNTQCPVYIGANRQHSIEQLLKNHDCNIIISDDGLQHYQMMRDIELCIVDGHRLFGNKKLLPAGPLREPLSRINDCDFIIVNDPQHDSTPINASNTYCVHPTVMPFRNLSGKLASISTKKCYAVAGIANPEKFFKSLISQGFKITRCSYPDHHHYSQDDFSKLTDDPIIMTEKDAVKCKFLELPNAYFQPISITLPDDFTETFIKKITSISSLHSSSKE
jgi:tetraacyldisaccharide 4'-kinase